MAPKPTVQRIIKDKGWAKIRQRLEEFNKHSGEGVKVGVLQTAGDHGDGISTVEIAAIHEFGSPAAGIPQRSFLRIPIRQNKEVIAKAARALLKKVVEGKVTREQALSVLGQLGVKIVKGAITQGEGIPPPLKPETIRRKGSSRPLVDTGKLVNSITYQVEGSDEAGGGSEAGGSDPEVESDE